MPKYENSIIYKLKRNEDYDDTDIYVGSTTNFKNRKYQHKNRCINEKDKNYNFPVYQFIRNNGGWGQWVMIPIEQYPCNSKKELEVRERHHIDILRPTLNKNIPTRTIKEWRNDNKDLIAKKEKKWREDNKEKLQKYFKQYHIDNQEKILEKNKEYRDDNKEYYQEYSKKYRENNKEIISEKAKQRIICDYCGCEIVKYYLKLHQKTKKCIESQKDDIAGQI